MSAGGLPFERPLRLAVLTNPDSGRNRAALPEVRRLLRRHAGVAHAEARDPAEVAAAVAELTDPRPDVLAVNGGDGTVQAVLTALFLDSPAAGAPALALLRGGTTNMTADDVGLRGPLLPALRGLLTLGEPHGAPARLVRRPVLRVETGAGAPVRLGMFFGAGVIVNGIEYLHRALQHRYGDALAAVLFYGSCLRSGDLRDGLVDLYAVVDGYRAAYRSPLLAAANRLLPPSVFYLELPLGEARLRCKYAVISLPHLLAATSPRWFHSYFWGRLTQPTVLVYTRGEVVWKLERHAGAPIDVPDGVRRHPLIYGWGFMWRLYRQGLFR